MSQNMNGSISSMISSIFSGIDATQFLILLVFALLLLALREFLRISGRDILKGNNIEVALAFVFTFLGISGIVPESLVLPFTLALLAFISVSNLKNRKILEKIERNSSVDRGMFVKDFSKEEVNRNIEQAKEVIFFGTKLGNVIPSQYSRIEDSLKKGNKINILLIEPNNNLCDLAAKREYPGTTGENILKELNINIDLCKNLYLNSKQTKGKLEIGFLHFIPAFGGIFVDPMDDNGILYLWLYTYKTKDRMKPKVVLHAADGKWYQLFKEMIISLWTDARKYQEQEEEKIA